MSNYVGKNPSGPAGGELGGLYPNPTIEGSATSTPSFKTVQLTTGQPSPTPQEGLVYWDDTDKTVSVVTDIADVVLQVGQETHIRVVNKSGVDIKNGEAVYITGAFGDQISVAQAQANSEATSFSTIGVATVDIDNDATGIATLHGNIRGINTNSFNEGDVLYVSPTVAGGITNVIPVDPNALISIGYVVKKGIADGIIFIDVQHYRRFPQEIHVTKSGDDFTYDSVKDAADFLATVATANNRYTLVINPGDYYEDNPITIPDYVSVIATGRHENTRIFCNNSDQHGVICGKDMDIAGLQVRDAYGSGKAGFYLPAGATDCEFHDCKIRDCDIGWLNEAANQTGIMLRASLITGGTCTSAYHGTANTYVNISDFQVPNGGGGATFTNWIYGTGSGCVITMEPSSCLSLNVTNGINIQNGATFQSAGVGVNGATTGIRIGTDATAIFTSGGCEDCTNDVVLESATSTLNIVGSWIHQEKIIGIDVGTVFGAFLSDTAGDEGFNVIGELHVGSKEAGKESCLGGGDSYFWGMDVFTNTNLEVGTWADHTTAARSPTGSTFVAFAGITADNCLYIGSDYTFPGIKVLSTAAMVLGAGAVAVEYWNGSAWIEINHMSSDSNSPYEQYADAIFERASNEQVRFPLTMTGWATKTLNGSEKYWIRVRITTGITTAPTIQQFKCHTHRAEINADGFTEFFGGARSLRPYVFNLTSLTYLAGVSPANEDISYGTTLVLAAIKNELVNGKIDATGGSIKLLSGTDTSNPLVFEVYCYPKATGGNYEINLRTAVLPTGTILNGTAAETDHLLVKTAGAVGVPQKFTYEIDVSALVPGDTIAFGIFRNALAGNDPPDTLAGNVVIESITVLGTRWHV